MSNIPMLHTQMVTRLLASGVDIIDQLTPDKVQVLHMCTGLSVKTAELFSSIQDERCSVLETMIDIEFYFEGLQQSISSTTDLYFPHAPDILYQILGTNSQIIELVKLAGNILNAAKRLLAHNACMKDEHVVLACFMKQFRERLDLFYQDNDIRLSSESVKKAGVTKVAQWEQESITSL